MVPNEIALHFSFLFLYEVCRDEGRRDEVRRATTTTKMATSTAMALFMMKDGEVFTPPAALLLGRQSV